MYYYDFVLKVVFSLSESDIFLLASVDKPQAADVARDCSCVLNTHLFDKLYSFFFI